VKAAVVASVVVETGGDVGGEVEELAEVPQLTFCGQSQVEVLVLKNRLPPSSRRGHSNKQGTMSGPHSQNRLHSNSCGI